MNSQLVSPDLSTRIESWPNECLHLVSKNISEFHSLIIFCNFLLLNLLILYIQYCTDTVLYYWRGRSTLYFSCNSNWQCVEPKILTAKLNWAILCKNVLVKITLHSRIANKLTKNCTTYPTNSTASDIALVINTAHFFLQIKLNPIMKTNHFLSPALADKNMFKPWRIFISGQTT